MVEENMYLIFLCTGAAKAGDKKLSHRIASRLTTVIESCIGTLSDLQSQHSALPEDQKRMIFINDCRSSCVNVFTHGFEKDKYVYVDIANRAWETDFDVDASFACKSFQR
jgi:uncharacterized metal-binding protein